VFAIGQFVELAEIFGYKHKDLFIKKSQIIRLQIQIAPAMASRNCESDSASLYETASHTEHSEVTEVGVGGRLRRKKMFSEVSVSSNEVGVIVNPTVSEFSKVSFSINLAVFLASGLALMNPFTMHLLETTHYAFSCYFK
jgi:hypothetical protein